MNWRDYEKEIWQYFQDTYPGTTIVLDKKIPGKYSLTQRQIDIYIEGEIAGNVIKIVIDCKYFDSKIDVKDVESFCGMVEDVDAHQGILITHRGYSQAAINRAFHGPQKVELDIINFDNLEKFQALESISYVGHFAVLVTAPFGWMTDLKGEFQQLPTLFQRGSNLEDAVKRKELIYFEVIEKFDSDYSIDSIIDEQNQNLIEKFPQISFEYKQLKRSDGSKCKIRISNIEGIPEPYVEVAGFIEFGKHLLLTYLITPMELLRKNQRKLEHVLATVKSFHLAFDNKKVIDQCLQIIDTSQDDEEKAQRHFQIGIWFREMDDEANALIHFRKADSYQPRNYKILKRLIQQELMQNNFPECFFCCKLFLELDPKNPTVYMDIAAIFGAYKKEADMIDFLKGATVEYNDIEVLGNLYFNIGLSELSLSRKIEAYRHLELARECFSKVFPKNHYIFKELAKILSNK